MNGQVARSNIKRFCSMPLLPDAFSCRTKSPSQDKRSFYLAVYLSRSGVQNTGLTSAPALETELELRAFCLVSILPRPLYFDPQERFRKLARERRDQRSRKKERQNQSKRAAKTARRAASKTLETFEITLALVQIYRRDQCASRT